MEAQENTDFPLSEREAITWICGAVVFCCICMSVPIVHLVPMLTDEEFSLEFATSVLMVLMFCGAFGRVLGGKLGDVIGSLPAYMVMSLGQSISVILFNSSLHFLSTYFKCIWYLSFGCILWFYLLRSHV